MAATMRQISIGVVLADNNGVTRLRIRRDG